MIVQGLIFQGEGPIVPVESHHTPTGAPSTSPPHLSSPPRSFTRQETEVPQPSSPIHTYVADEAASTGMDVRHGEAATTVTSLDVGQGSGNIDKAPSMPHDSPLLRVNTLGCDEGSMSLQELTVLCTTLSQKVESFEADLKQTKQVYGAAYTKLIIKVKRLEKTAKTGKARRKAQIVVSDDEEEFEDPSKQGRSMIEEIDQDVEVTLKKSVTTSSGRVSTASRMISTAKESVSTASASMPVSNAGMVDKGKGIMEESELDVIKTKRKQEQERLEEEWENIRARVEADEELTQKIQAEERDKYSEVDQVKILVDLINRRKRYFVKQKAEAKKKKPMTQAQQRTYINDFVPMESEDDKDTPKLAKAKRDAEEELDQGRSKKQKIGESSGARNKDVDELSQKELQQLMIIVPEQGMNVKALQTKYPIIDLEIYTKDTRKY
uniref:Putative ribonuclease H-like domain-containing protein n=1 Tax=Tanacetum cinerariifolium TaxID=118510 RepID=A0A6L2LK67_TANCI|nr:putative ribonuclease H-like domain-containing protein [Tanacetum cinerariifolium]